MNVLAELRLRFEKTLRPLCADPAAYTAMIRPAQDKRFGDFQANCAMPLAKERSAKPRDVAAEIVAHLDVADLCDPPEIAGPGFINLRLKDAWLQAAVNCTAADERLGVTPAARPRRVVVDFSGPNVAKPMHVGHLRSSVLGDALCRVLRFLGHTVVGDNHIGDWGTQFGMIIYGYKHFRDESAFAREPVAELARLYRLVNQLSDYHEALAEIPKQRQLLDDGDAALERLHATYAIADEDAVQKALKDKALQKTLKKLQADLQELRSELAGLEEKVRAVEGDPRLKALADAHPDIAEQARLETARLHANDAENRRLWDEFLPQCLAALDAMYRRLGVTFDVQLGESYYQPMLADVVRDLQEQGIARESEGAICVFLEGRAAPLIVRKRDGAFTYATTDLATIRYRAEEIKADEILYVVDARQSDHFQMAFQTARRWGYDRIDYRHITFGTILGEDKRPYKTRSGDTVGLESLIDEAIARARRIVDENDDAKPGGPELDEAQRARVAEIVGLGGIKYADLRHNRESDYVFSWDKMLATTGDTATYVQYSYARVAGIFRKGGVAREAVQQSAAEIRLTHPSERELALQLVRFAEALDETAADYRPNLLTQYLFDTANLFSTFYNECPVKNEPDEAIRASRFRLCDLTARVLAQGLGLLGIGTSEQM